MRNTGNDYSEIGRAFAARTGQDICHLGSADCDNFALDESISIVISSFNGHSTIPAALAALHDQRYQNFELVLVDDGSDPPIQELLRDVALPVSTTLVRLPRNYGLSLARNIGVQISQGDSVIFMDDDMRPRPNMTAAAALRQAHTTNCIFVGFREDTDPGVFFGPPARVPSIEGDWRFHSDCPPEQLVVLAADQRAPRFIRQHYSLVDESSLFTAFGLGRTIGAWDLPAMVAGHSICAKRVDIVQAGGWTEGHFEGWGVEDLAFGALMIARGHFVVPALDWLSFHLRHEGRRATRSEEWEQMKRNVSAYLRFIEERVMNQRFPEHRLRDVKCSGPYLMYELQE